MKTEFKVGDKVRRIKDEFSGMKVGDIGTITECSYSLTLDEYGNGHMKMNFELVTEKREFKVGDKVKRINYACGEMKVGYIGTIRKIKSDKEYIHLNEYDVNKEHYYLNLELITEKVNQKETKMTEKDITKFDKKALKEAVEEIAEERLDKQKEEAKTKLREIYSRKDISEDNVESENEKLKGINKELNVVLKAIK